MFVVFILEIDRYIRPMFGFHRYTVSVLAKTADFMSLGMC